MEAKWMFYSQKLIKATKKIQMIQPPLVLKEEEHHSKALKIHRY